MSPYIVNITNNLLGEHNFPAVFEDFKQSHRNLDEFVEHVRDHLKYNNIRKMSSETLGKIMCSFEAEDSKAGNKSLVSSQPFKDMSFDGNGAALLREMVATSLAYTIRARLEGYV